MLLLAPCLEYSCCICRDSCALSCQSEQQALLAEPAAYASGEMDDDMDEGDEYDDEDDEMDGDDMDEDGGCEGLVWWGVQVLCLPACPPACLLRAKYVM
jgi:hypothetical protein